MLAVGCGGDNEPESAERPAPGSTVPAEPPADRAPRVPPREPGKPPAEAQPPADGKPPPRGGAGEESEPAVVEAVLTGRGGRLTPAVVRVPPYVSVRVVLVSDDGDVYGLLVQGARLRVDAGTPRARATLPGLRPQASYVGKPTEGGPRVTIEASAEPGP